jgi:Ca-activated chloride channel family protein
MNSAHRILASCFVGLVISGGGAIGLCDGKHAEFDAFSQEGVKLGPCLLKHTSVDVHVADSVARITVTQEYRNRFDVKVNAVYLFPLSNRSAVDRMTMTVGDRVVRGVVKERSKAKREYEHAKRAGKVASLLDQERPNIFTQSVANIGPGADVQISISYCETLKWKDGQFNFEFPMVVGPRYIPVDQATQVPDAKRISASYALPETRTGHDISLKMTIDAGVPIRDIQSHQHDIEIDYSPDKRRAIVQLKNKKTVPNRDFVLTYRTATDKIQDSLLTHTDRRGKFFSLTLVPPRQVTPEVHIPREVIFVIDKSGSMSGFPIETAKEAMRLCIKRLHHNDSFNLITFSGGLGNCFETAVPNSKANRRKAIEYLANLHGSGGTKMLTAIEACLSGKRDPKRLRCVCLMTDGYVGNDGQIIDTVKQYVGNARIFSFGIGTSVNRYLLDSIAYEGGGEVEYVLSNAACRGAAERFHQRIQGPVLTNISLDVSRLADSCFGLSGDVVGGDAEVFVQLLEGARGAKAVHANELARRTNVLVPTLANASFHTDSSGNRWRKNAVDVALILLVKQFPTGKTDNSSFHAIGSELGLSFYTNRNFTSGCCENHFGVAIAVNQYVTTFGCAFGRRV